MPLPLAPALVLPFLTAILPPPGHQAPPSECLPPADHPTRPARASGAPDDGKLHRAHFLAESGSIRHVDAWGCHFWGTDTLVGALQRVAARIEAEHPGARLTVGELSMREGGDIAGHRSHENGLDVDLGFYWTDEHGLPYEPRRLLQAGPDRRGHELGRTLTFDLARNWALIEGLLTDPSAELAVVVVNAQVRQWLLDHARATGVGRRLRRRAAKVIRIPRPGRHPHRNHFHVRIFCPEHAGACRDLNR